MIRKNDPDAIHKTPELYKAANDKRNAVRRDVLSTARSGRSIAKKGEPYQPLTLIEIDANPDIGMDPEFWLSPPIPAFK